MEPRIQKEKRVEPRNTRNTRKNLERAPTGVGGSAIPAGLALKSR